MKYLCTHTHTHTGRGESVCECLCLCLFLHERRPVLCKYTPSTVEGGLRGVGVDGRRTDWLTGPASCLINRQFAKVDTCTARIILGHTWAPFWRPPGSGLDPERSNRSNTAVPALELFSPLCGCILRLWTLAWWVYLCVCGAECVLSWLVWLMKRHWQAKWLPF